jgi:hypothetical protein
MSMEGALSEEKRAEQKKMGQEAANRARRILWGFCHSKKQRMAPIGNYRLPLTQNIR